MKRTVLLAIAVPALVAAIAWFPLDNQRRSFHSEEEKDFFKNHLSRYFPQAAAEGPGDPVLQLIDSSILFPTAKQCGGCHGYDPNQHALVTTTGLDVNMYDDWRASMMANSARDPFWRAKVAHEMQVNPSHSVALQDKCTSCHAPAGHYQAKLKAGAGHYLMSDLYQDSLGLDGVTCQACHAQAPALIGSLHSGQLNFDTNHIRVAYGPYEFVFAPPMATFVGITPIYGDHIFDAGLCAGCHTLITESVDMAGAFTGNTFVEQATYHEWLNSRFDKEHDNVTCQACHMQSIQDEIIISNNYQFLTPKFPYALHDMSGANVTMLKLLRDNREALGITTPAALFDSALVATLQLLQHRSLAIDVTPVQIAGDSAVFGLKLSNLTGHKFPSGYPSRRAWVECTIQDENGQLLLHSGKMNPDFTLYGEDPNYEPHYTEITGNEQVLIYELTPGDVQGNFTNVLERGYSALKDNRIPPQGFRKDDPVYDTTRIAGEALLDPDFNIDANGDEGSGSDIVYYKIPLNGFSGRVSVLARVWYQSLPPKWMNPIFEWSAPDIDQFKDMYLSADLSPVLVAEKHLPSVYVNPVGAQSPTPERSIQVFPTLTEDGKVYLQLDPGIRLAWLRVWHASGRLIEQRSSDSPIQLLAEKGAYFIEVQTNAGRVVRKVVRG